MTGSVLLALVLAVNTIWSEENANALLRAIARAPADGLVAADYAPERPDDGALTSAFLALANDLARGRRQPETSEGGWCSTPPRIDFAALLAPALETNTIEETLARLAPPHEEYRKLREALQVYRAMMDWPAIPAGRALRRGDEGARVALLRARLGLEGQPPKFDERVDALLRDFQRHHGLADDGVAGPATLGELNVPRARRVEQIVLNLERWRWMPRELPRRHLRVNVAAFELELIDGDTTTLAMRIVAGKEYTKTPFFSACVQSVTVNPPWNVPDSIAEGELWPKQRRDPQTFAREHIRVLPGGRLRQDPGPWCALGRIKFEMPNRYNVYLHDTPAKTLFSRDLRAFSHGCIRLEKPRELAVALTGVDVEPAIASGREQSIRLAEPVTVYVLYWTAFVADDGHVEFRRDVYGFDYSAARSRIR